VHIQLQKNGIQGISHIALQKSGDIIHHCNEQITETSSIFTWSSACSHLTSACIYLGYWLFSLFRCHGRWILWWQNILKQL